MKRAIIGIIVLGFAAASTTGCSNLGKTEKGALTGTAIGAGLGAIIGNQTGRAGEGVAIGSALGGLSGAAIGYGQQGTEDRQEELDEKLRRQDAELERQRRELEELRRQNQYDNRGSSGGSFRGAPAPTDTDSYRRNDDTYNNTTTADQYY